jgi:hypothetical protein
MSQPERDKRTIKELLTRITHLIMAPGFYYL